MRTSHCHFCNGLIVWCQLPSGKKIPLDAEPGYAGRYLYSEGRSGEAFARLVAKGEKNHGDRLRAHFSSCTAKRRLVSR